MRIKFSVNALKALRPGGATYDCCDEGYSSQGSLYVRVTAKGARTINVQFRLKDGKQTKRRLHILEDWLASGASIGELRAEAARAVAEGRNAGVTTSVAKAIERSKRSGSAAPLAVKGATVGWLRDAYLERRRTVSPFQGKSAKTNLRALELMLDRVVRRWGADKLVRDLTKTDAEDLLVHISTNHGPSAANRTRGTLPKALKFAKRSDKAVDVDLFKDLDIDPAYTAKKPRTTVLTSDERPRFFTALKAFEAREDQPRPNRKGGYRRPGIYCETAEMLRLIYFCAARKGEALQAVWGEIDLDAGTWFMPEAKRKNGEHTMDLPQAAIEVLERQRERYSDAGDEVRVFPMLNEADLWADFHVVKEMAGITSDLCIHDLRASRVTQWATEGERPLPEVVISRMIGSKDVKGLVRTYVRDSASEEERKARVNAEGDDELV